MLLVNKLWTISLAESLVLIAMSSLQEIAKNAHCFFACRRAYAMNVTELLPDRFLLVERKRLRQ
jgi:hypothetical protein